MTHGCPRGSTQAVEVPQPLPVPGTSVQSTVLGLGVIFQDGTSRPSDGDGTEPRSGLSVNAWVVVRSNLSCSPQN